MHDIKEILTVAATVAKDVVSIAALLTLFIKPLRERIFGSKAVKDGQKCLLRTEIMRTYYRHQDTQKLRQYEAQNLVYCYDAYKALGGNSFVDHIYQEMQTWDVTT